MKFHEGSIVPRALVALAWAWMLAVLVGALAIEAALRDAGRSDLGGLNPPEAIIFPMAILGAAVVGSVLALRRPGNLAGWLFLSLALSIMFSGGAESYVVYGAVHDPGSLPAARLVAVYADGVFLIWVFLLTLILLVTPTGSAPSPKWRAVGWAAAASCAVFLVAIPFRTTSLDSAPFQDLTSPYRDTALSGAATTAAFVAVATAHAALLGAIASLFVRARNATAEERLQLRWLLVPAIPFPFLVAGAWIAAVMGNESLLVVLGGGYLVIIPIAAGLAIEKQGLYNVDRVISRTVAYTVLSALILGVYVAVAFAAGITAGRAASQSVPVAVGATLAGVALAGVVRKRVQDAFDRRFNRRAFTALERIRRYVREPEAGISIEEALREASGDPALAVAYWSDGRESWVTEDGVTTSPAPAAIEIKTSEGGPAVAVSSGGTGARRELLRALIAEAWPALENARLRAAISLQLVEVRESRARIVSAQLAERKRIERDLHDGSQQRLLALAMNLRATELSGDGAGALKALPRAIDEIQATVRELRELANGLHPGTLEDGGLSAALQELAARAPIAINLDVLERRWPAPVELSAWFIACEAITNVVKHARASTVSVAAAEEGGMLVLSIEDDGVGGADAMGHGLRGMADRAETAGGQFSVRDRVAGGTSIRAVLPCEL